MWAPAGLSAPIDLGGLANPDLDLGVAILAKAAHGEAPGPHLQKHLDSVRASICPNRRTATLSGGRCSIFFGRQAAIDKLADAVQGETFVAIVGASGSGKSSVVSPGLVPRLRSGQHTAWETVILVPTDQPLKALVQPVATVVGADDG